ncbi:hypothetical protein KIN20_030654 [Parelaphostrongylus tenuis]|uniref:Uncharacterized protein n=1 Tax=Parelaphostrongylus tenuis TaxID=148309 RepID=A0AAD5R420_PARTN|nr:hypothetical protein KIN20_030654 [Parelaphostrongylus tenuis]
MSKVMSCQQYIIKIDFESLIPVLRGSVAHDPHYTARPWYEFAITLVSQVAEPSSVSGFTLPVAMVYNRIQHPCSLPSYCTKQVGSSRFCETTRNANNNAKVEQSCIIVGNTVTGICGILKGGGKMCMNAEKDEVTISPANSTYLTIVGTLSTANIIMSNWSRALWQNVDEQSSSIAGIGSIRVALLLGICHVIGN